MQLSLKHQTVVSYIFACAQMKKITYSVFICEHYRCRQVERESWNFPVSKIVMLSYANCALALQT